MTNALPAGSSPCANSLTKDELATSAWSSTRHLPTAEMRTPRTRFQIEPDRVAYAPRFCRSVRDRAPHGESPADLLDAMKAIIESSVAG